MNNFNQIIYIILLINLLALIINLGVSLRYIFRRYRDKELIKVRKKKFTILRILVTLAIPLVSLGAAIYFYTNITPKIIDSTPDTEGVWQSYDKPLEVFFNTPIDGRRLVVNMNPEIDGDWIFPSVIPLLPEGNNILSNFTNYGYFIPKETILPNQRVVVYITGIGRAGMRNDYHEYGFVFDPVQPPEITKTSPLNNTIGVSEFSKVELELDKDTNESIEWRFEFTPEIEHTVSYPDKKNITITTASPFDLSEEYTLKVFRKVKSISLESKEVFDEENFENVHEIKFTTRNEPLIRSYIPRGNAVRSDSMIKIKFMSEIDQTNFAEYFSVTPDITGELVWKDTKTLEFIPDNDLEKDTKYSVNIKKGIKSLEGIESQNDINFEFKTIGYINLLGTSPQNGEVKVSENQRIELTFDQEVDRDSAQSKLSITPGAKGDITWEGNKLIFTPTSPLQFNTLYTVKVGSGIKSIYGLDSNVDLTTQFTTRSNEVLLSIPQYYQPQIPVSFSCNIYTAKMVLGWKGYQLEASSMISEIGYNSNQSNGNWSGNPYKEYVGSNDGFYGYGAYAGALKELFDNRDIYSEIKDGYSISQITRDISAGRPVIIWRRNDTQGGTNDISWTASDGTFVKAITSQHGSVVTGFRGSIDNPTALFLNDPWYGPHWKDINDFDYKWGLLGRMALVVY